MKFEESGWRPVINKEVVMGDKNKMRIDIEGAITAAINVAKELHNTLYTRIQVNYDAVMPRAGMSGMSDEIKVTIVVEKQ